MIDRVLTTLELIAFPGAPNLPIFAAAEHGYFADEGIKVNLTTTPSSAFQAENLASGKFDIAATAFDNVVAYCEGQGAVKFDTPPDFTAFMGATRLELAFVVAPSIASYDDLRDKSLALDALGTGFAFVLYQMLEKAGLPAGSYKRVAVGATPQRWESVKAGEHVGTLTIEPFTSLATAAGFRVLDTSQNHYQNYQGGIFAARKSWLNQHPMAAQAFIRGYLKGLEWSLNPANRTAAGEILLRNMPAIKPGVVNAVLDKLLSPATGLTPRGEVDMEGVKKVLELRSLYGEPKRALTDTSAYFDLSHYERAIKA